MGQCYASTNHHTLDVSERNMKHVLENKYTYLRQLVYYFAEEFEIAKFKRNAFINMNEVLGRLMFEGFQNIYDIIEFFCYLPSHETEFDMVKVQTIFAGYTLYYKKNQIKVHPPEEGACGGVRGWKRKYKTSYDIHFKKKSSRKSAVEYYQSRIFYNICVLIDIVNIECCLSENTFEWEKKEFLQVIEEYKSVKPHEQIIRTMFNLCLAMQYKYVMKKTNIEQDIEENEKYLEEHATSISEDIIECTKEEIDVLKMRYEKYTERKYSAYLLYVVVIPSKKYIIQYTQPDFVVECHCNTCEACVEEVPVDL